MSLYVCHECGCVENTGLVNKMLEDSKLDLNPDYPNMTLMSMQGADVKDLTIFDSNTGKAVVYKKANEIKMLCTECNFGRWHNKFNKRKANDREIELAKYSMYNLITPFDHENGCITSVNDRELSYKVHPFYAGLHSYYRELYSVAHTTMLANSMRDKTIQKAYNVFIDKLSVFKDSFDYDKLRLLKDGTAKSFVDFLEYHSMKPLKHKMIDLLKDVLKDDPEMTMESFEFIWDMYNKRGGSLPKRKHWKLTQDPVDRETALAKAEEKRLRKLNKKR